MSTAEMLNTCAACGAEESLDSVLLRMIDDEVVRRLIADVITTSLPVGGLVVSYLRLFKPNRQKLRMAKVAAVLHELVPDIRRGAITRKGREWQAPMEAWRTALQSVLDARDKGQISLPLDGNAYLYEAVMRLADKSEAMGEKERERDARSRPHTGGFVGVGNVTVTVVGEKPSEATSPPLRVPTVPEPSGPKALPGAEVRERLAATRRAITGGS